MSEYKRAAAGTLGEVTSQVLALSHKIHANPELGFNEYLAASQVASTMEEAGFEVERGIADLPTALCATYGRGELVIGLFAEYDALPGIGHACGHNLIAAAAVAAGLILAPLAEDLNLTVKLFGTPAEEGGGGKILMLDSGAFDDLHAVMMVHPIPGADVLDPRMLAASHLRVEYTGRAAHAAAAPQQGIDAADAFTVAEVGLGLLRDHLPARSRVNGIVTEAGAAPNIVPAHTAGRFIVRAESLEELQITQARVTACFEAGALGTGATLGVTTTAPTYAELNTDPAMAGLYLANAEHIGRVFSAEPPERLLASYASGDIGNVSRVIPTIHPCVGIDCGEAVNHQPEFTEVCGSPAGDQAALDGALSLAWTGIDLAGSPEERRRLLARPTRR